VLAFNRAVDGETATEIAKTFVEAIAAPDYSADALNLLTLKKNLRLLRVMVEPQKLVVKSISGGFLVQTADTHRLSRSEMQVKTKRAPSDAEWTALEFGWKVAKHVKSNAIVYARAGQTVGVGAGQMSRVDSVQIAVRKAGDRVKGSVLASDAFFPFRDNVDAAAAAGVIAIIQPGGSVKDADSIAACDEHGIAMVFTGVRHFRH
jgi:phosphoribosylaminoimidazolecarboxamide formyltransferase/IMP cyclohydrolase